jgi:hypothetical protein
MAESTIFDQLNTNVDSYETKVLNAITVNSFQANGPNGTIIFNSSQSSIPGFIAESASLAFTASTAPLYLPLVGGTITGNLTVNGTAYLNSVVSNTSSYNSGSTIFGDALTDTHRFTGSVYITGSSLTWNNSTLIASNVTSSMSVASASQALTASYFNGNSVSASYASTASFLLGSVTSASYATTASYISGSVISASHADTASKIFVTNLALDPGTYYPMFANSTYGPVNLFADALTYTYQPSTNILTVTASLSLGVSASDSISSITRETYDSIGTSSIDWENRILGDSNSNKSIDWSVRDIYDDLNVLAIRYTTRRQLFDDVEAVSLDWRNRWIVDSAGTTTLDWSTNDKIIINGTLDASNIVGNLTGTASWATNALTASLAPNYVLNSATSSFITSTQTSSMSVATASLALRASGSLTGSLLGTSSWATNAITASYVTPYEGAWTSYTPIWTTDGATQPVIGNGSITGAYKQIGKTVFVRVKLNAGSSTTFGAGAFQFSLPVTASSPDGIQFPCSILDNGIHWYQGIVNGTYTGATHKSAIIYPNTSGWSDAVTSTAPFTWGNTDSLQFNGSYESI